MIQAGLPLAAAAVILPSLNENTDQKVISAVTNTIPKLSAAKDS